MNKNDSSTSQQPGVNLEKANVNHVAPNHKIHIPKPAEELLEKTPRRVKGISRKFLLRAINRKIIVRLARRASIGVPLLGFYFAQNTFRSDLSQAMNKENPDYVRNGYKFVTAIDGIDLAAQTFMITGLVSTLYFQTTDFSSINFAEIIKYTDKISIGCAISSTVLGTYIELKKEHDLEIQNSLNTPDDKPNDKPN